MDFALIQWVKNNAPGPLEAIDHFMSRSDYVCNALDAVVGHARAKIIQRTRQHLQQLADDPVFTAQFPMVYGCESLDGEAIRDTVALTMDEREAHWVGRVWADDRFLGELRRSGSGPTSNYMALARMHIESQIRCPGKLGKPLAK